MTVLALAYRITEQTGYQTSAMYLLVLIAAGGAGTGAWLLSRNEGGTTQAVMTFGAAILVVALSVFAAGNSASIENLRLEIANQCDVRRFQEDPGALSADDAAICKEALRLSQGEPVR